MEDISLQEDSGPTRKTRSAIPNLKLRQERELRGWSQAMVAEKLGAQPALVNRWENGYAFPSPYYREKLCLLFEKNAEELGLIKKTIAEVQSEEPATFLEVCDERTVETVPTEKPVEQPGPSSQPGRIFTRREVLLGTLGGIGVGGGVLGWWIQSSIQPPPPLTIQPSLTNMYVYKTDPQVWVNFVSWSPHGSFIACAAGDNTVKVLEAQTGAVVYIYRGHKDFVECAKWSPDETRIASTSKDKTVQIWKAQSGEAVLTYRGHSKSVYCVTWSHDGTRIASSGADTTVQVWDALSGVLLTTYHGHTQGVWNITWSPDDASIATCGLDGGIHVWNPGTGANSPTFVYQGPAGTVTEIDWSPVGDRIVSTHIDSSVHIWDALTGYNVLTYTGHTAQTETARWSPDGRWVSSGADDNTVQIWNASNGKRLLIDRLHTDQITEVCWSPDGKHLASGSKDKTVHVCKIAF